MKFLLLLCCCLIAVVFHAQTRQVIVTVIDDDRCPVANALIRLEGVGVAPFQGPSGVYTFEKIPRGTYQLKILKSGFKGVKKSIVIDDESLSLSITLRPSAHVLEEVVVRNATINDQKRQEQLNLEIVTDEFIQKHLGGSLMQSLERLPGVKTIGIGSGQSKPLIRGLGFNRVVVIDKGVKHEGQQWGADHGLEIDQFDVEEAEILKGAASFAYGSDAIAGAVNLRPPGLPGPESFGGDVNLIGKTNNGLYGTSVHLYGRTHKWFATGRVSFQDYGDYRVPADSLFVYDFPVQLYQRHLRNTAGRELSLHASSGYITDRLRAVFYVDDVFTQSGFFANAHGLEPRRVDAALHDRSSRDILMPYQQVNHFKIVNRARAVFGNHAVETEAGYQHNRRKEYNHYVNHGYMPPVYPDTLAIPMNLERLFDKTVYSLRIKDLVRIGNHDLQFGINGDLQNNIIGGWSFVVPSFNQRSIGAFIYDKVYVNHRAILHGALRYDHSFVHIKSYKDWFPSPVETGGIAAPDFVLRAARTNRYFNSVTGAVGINYNLKQVELKANIGKSFRVPLAKELAANGVNYHYFSYEKGNANLDPEQSYQVDAGVVWTHDKWHAEVSPFFNYFPNYIYLNPTANHDYLYGAGNQVFEYAQSRVLRYGGELRLKYRITETLGSELLGEYLYAEQLSGSKKGFGLPFSPPPSLLLNLLYEPVHTAPFKRTYISVDLRLTAAQNNIVPPERKTDRYTVMHIQAGTRFRMQNQEAWLSLQLQNVWNTRYMIHTSFYRLIGLPEQGRNLVVSLKLPFNFPNKKKTI
ncbi:TonB-dependent receptor [Niabella insulamsoli]|uniref:TonB-dependent receptor n=1 Tax=Niabella insulamsoli TaxID=3144874 RepID=UPI0031FDF43A